MNSENRKGLAFTLFISVFLVLSLYTLSIMEDNATVIQKVYDLTVINDTCVCEVEQSECEVVVQQVNITNYERHYTTYTESAFKSVIGYASDDRPYLLDVYDCTEMAKEVKHDLTIKGGYQERVVDDYQVVVDCKAINPKTNRTYFEPISCNKYGGNHRIVCINGFKGVCIEPTSGRVIMPYEYGVYGIK